MGRLARFLKALPLILISPFLTAAALATLAIADFAWLLRRRPLLDPEKQPSTRGASVVIPTWNARELLEQYLPSVVAALDGNPDNEIILVDNASTDGTV
jgi:cellulose synthase/poly-beta-1,6-N-acetylglucosamine synthase-like glycosyltransferase